MRQFLRERKTGKRAVRRPKEEEQDASGYETEGEVDVETPAP